MIRFIRADQTLALRSRVLRNGQPEKQCVFDQDTVATTFHLGYYDDQDQLLSILTCVKEKHGKLPKEAYRLRGMATLPEAQRQGYAKELLYAALIHLKEQLGIEYLWFNARAIAFPFYEALGFEFMSDEFEISGIGAHREMFIYL